MKNLLCYVWVVRNELCQHPLEARGFHDVYCNLYRVGVSACQVNARHSYLVFIAPLDLEDLVQSSLTRDIEDHLNVRIG